MNIIVHRMKYGNFVILVLFALVLGVASRLTVSQDSAAKEINSTFFVSCSDDENRALAWLGPKGSTVDSTRLNVHKISTGLSLIFHRITKDDVGTYTCVAGKDKKEFRMTVAAPLKFMDTPAEQFGEEGKDVILRCEVEDGTITWLGTDIKDKRYAVMGDGLSIKNANRSDSGTYVCSAYQESTGNMINRTITLKILHKPTFPQPVYAKQEQAWGYMNGTVNLTCTVIAEPPATFKWVRTSQKLENGRTFNVSANESVLQLRVNKLTFGSYKCIASNNYGRLEKVFSLDEGVKPYPPTFIEMKGANANLLDIGIHGPSPQEVEIPAGMETVGYNVQYKPLEDKSNWESRDFNVTEDNGYLLDNLHHQTKYAVRVATRNPAGLSDYTNISIFETLISQADSVHLALPSCSFNVNLVVILVLTYYLPHWLSD